MCGARPPLGSTTWIAANCASHCCREQQCSLQPAHRRHQGFLRRLGFCRASWGACGLFPEPCTCCTETVGEGLSAGKVQLSGCAHRPLGGGLRPPACRQMHQRASARAWPGRPAWLGTLPAPPRDHAAAALDANSGKHGVLTSAPLCDQQAAAMRADLSFEDEQLEHEFSKLQAGRSRHVGKQAGSVEAGGGLGARKGKGRDARMRHVGSNSSRLLRDPNRPSGQAPRCAPRLALPGAGAASSTCLLQQWYWRSTAECLHIQHALHPPASAAACLLIPPAGPLEPRWRVGRRPAAGAGQRGMGHRRRNLRRAPAARRPPVPAAALLHAVRGAGRAAACRCKHIAMLCVLLAQRSVHAPGRACRCRRSGSMSVAAPPSRCGCPVPLVLQAAPAAQGV